MLSFVLAAAVCGLCALSYAELAAMVPVAGSAYTFSYATLGQLLAFIIGWDLVLEFTVGSAAVGGRRRRLHRLDPRPGIRGQPADLDLRPAGGGWRHQPAGGAADRRARRPALPRRADHREGEHRARRGDAARAGGRDRDRRVQRRHRQLGSVHALRRRWDRRRGGAGLLRLHRPSTSSPRPPRRRATLSATCRRASSARWRS